MNVICPICNYGSILLWELRDTGAVLSVCDECEACWLPGTQVGLRESGPLSRFVPDITLLSLLPPVDPGEKPRSPLEVAVYSGTVSRVVALLAEGVSPDVRNEDGITPLHSASWARDAVEFAEAILDYGADIDARDIHGRTPLHIASALRRAKLVSFLVSRGADVDARAVTGDTPLHVAVTLPVVVTLLEGGADPSVQAAGVGTPLHAAARCSGPTWVQVGRVLLQWGADPTARDETGMTVREVADSYGHSWLTELIDA